MGGSPRYVIVGAGAIGAMIGGLLARRGVPTVWVARGEHGQVLARDGLTLRTPEGTSRIHGTVWAGPQDAELGPDDVLVIATKTHQVPQALLEWADLPIHPAAHPAAGGAGAGVVTRPGATAGEALPVVLATNGVAGEQLALRYFRRVYGMCVWAPATQLRPGEVVASFTPVPAVLHTSRVPATLTDDTDRALLTRLQQDWQDAGMSVRLPEDVMPWKYRKLVTNMNNVLEALLGPGRHDTLLSRAVAEARQILAAAGIEVTDDETEARVRAAGPTMAPVPGAPDQLGGSTWQSMVKGRRSLETDYLNGEIVLLAHQHGLDAPVNARLALLARRAAAAGLVPGDLTEAHLTEADLT